MAPVICSWKLQRVTACYLAKLLAGSCCIVALSFEPIYAQEGSVVEPPRFRLRTDANASSDAQLLREQLRYLVDSRGPINPLSDYGKRSATPTTDTARKPNARVSGNEDPDASIAPSLDKDSAKRLQASGLTLPSSTLGVIALLPPPTIRGAIAATTAYDDGFRPLSTSVLQASAVMPASALIPIYNSESSVRVANFYQDDPYANLPPTLTSPPVISGGTLPGGGALPGSIPGLPQGGQQLPPSSVPLSVPPSAPTMVPSYSQPAITQPMIPPPTMPSNAAPTAVIPAPPAYYVPAPMPMPQTGQAGMFVQPGVPYAANPMPTYNRAGTFVNSAPFVSPPPASVDARFMVSPAVWQQGSVATAPSCNPSIASTAAGTSPRPTPMGFTPQTVPMGFNGVAPTNGLVPPATASPFAYAPPAAMPPATIYAPANAGYVPVVGFGQGANAQLGRGLYGQPTAYVDGQPVRNFLRYIFP